MPLVSLMGEELDEWIKMYYTPCIFALFGMNVGQSPSAEVAYFTAYPWHHHSECMHLSCLTQNMRWDRSEGGGCVPGLMTGGLTATDYAEGDAQEKECAKDASCSNPYSFSRSSCKKIRTLQLQFTLVL